MVVYNRLKQSKTINYIEISFLLIFNKYLQQMRKIFLTLLEDKIHIFKPSFNILFIVYINNFKARVSNSIFYPICTKNVTSIQLITLLFILKEYLYMISKYSCKVFSFSHKTRVVFSLKKVKKGENGSQLFNKRRHFTVDFR